MCVYILERTSKVILYLLFYVDDILITNFSTKEIDNIKDYLDGEFELKYIGEAQLILGMDILINQEICEFILYLSSYFKKMVEQFRMLNDKTVKTRLDHDPKLSVMQYPQTKDGKNDKGTTPY